MNNDILIRLAEKKDLPQIIDLYQMSTNKRKYKLIYDWIDQQSEIFHVAELDSKIVGGVAIRFPQEGEAWLSHKMIDPTIRNAGIGTKMAVYEEEYAKEKGAKGLRLATKVDNYPVHWMIGEKSGYHQLSRWMRLRKLQPNPYPFYQMKAKNILLHSQEFSQEIDSDHVTAYISNHIDYLRSDRLIPYEKNLAVYTRLKLESLFEHETMQVCSIVDRGQIKAIAIYQIIPPFNELFVYQLYSDGHSYTHDLLFHLIQLAAKHNLVFSLFIAKPTYPILPILKNWVKSSSKLHSDWFVFGKEIK